MTKRTGHSVNIADAFAYSFYTTNCIYGIMYFEERSPEMVRNVIIMYERGIDPIKTFPSFDITQL